MVVFECGRRVEVAGAVISAIAAILSREEVVMVVFEYERGKGVAGTLISATAVDSQQR